MLALYNSYAETGNFGDILLLEVFRKWVEEELEIKAVFPLISPKKLKTFQKFFPNSYTGFQDHQSWKAFIYAGGGVFGEPNRVSGKRFSGKWNRTFFTQKALPAELCLLHKKPYGVIGVEAGPLSNVFTRWEFKRIVEHSTQFSVRNPESYEFLVSELKVKKSIDITLDPVLSLSVENIPEAALEKAALRLKTFKGLKLLGIHQPSYFMSGTQTAEQIIDSIVEKLKKSQDVVPVVFSDSGSEKSQKECEDLAEKISYLSNMKCISIPFEGIWEVIALVSNLSSLITTKLHVGVIAHILGIPCESFATHQKTSRFYKLINRREYSDAVESLTPERIDTKILRAFAVADQPHLEFDENWHALKKQALENLRILSSFI